MAEETMSNETEVTMTPEEVLVEMSKNTVPKSEYEELKEKYYKLFKATANGLSLGEEEKPKVETKEEADARVKQEVLDLYNKKKRGTVEHFKTLISLHDHLTSNGQRSCFAPSKGEVTEATERDCNTLRDLMAESVEACNGDDTACSTYFASRLAYGK